MVALNAWEWPAIARIKAANPDALVLVYKDLSSTRDSAPCSSNQDDLPTGVDYCSTNTLHPDWFLTDSAGNRLRYDAWPDSWQMDVGNPAYQQAWLDNVRAGLTTRSWDGVFMDNALSGADDHHPGTYPARYPSHASIQDAYRSMLATVGSGLRVAGFVTVANIDKGRLFPGLWRSYLANIDGAFEEWFVDWSGTPGNYAWDWGPTGWKAQVDEIVDAVAAGKIAIVRAGSKPAGQDQQGFHYALASYLLANDGRSLFGFGEDVGYEPQYDWHLGAALGAYYPLGNSVFRRDFSSGAVVVNAAQSSDTTVPLGKQYQDESGNLVTSVTVGAQGAAILRVPSPPPPSQPTPPTSRSPRPTARPPSGANTGNQPPVTAPVPAPATTGVTSQEAVPPSAAPPVEGAPKEASTEPVHESGGSELAGRPPSGPGRDAGRSSSPAGGLVGLGAVALVGVGAVAWRRRLRRATRSPN